MLASTVPDFNSRVVNVSSSAHRAGSLQESDNYNFERGGYNHVQAYANSKVASIYLANEIDRRYGSSGLHATSLHPGGISTNISRHLGPGFVQKLMANEYIAKIVKSSEQGAATTILAAIGKEWENKGGKYLEDCEEAQRGDDDNDTFGVGYVSHTYDPKEEERLWKDSLKIVGISK